MENILSFRGFRSNNFKKFKYAYFFNKNTKKQRFSFIPHIDPLWLLLYFPYMWISISLILAKDNKKFFSLSDTRHSKFHNTFIIVWQNPHKHQILRPTHCWKKIHIFLSHKEKLLQHPFMLKLSQSLRK